MALARANPTNPDYLRHLQRHSKNRTANPVLSYQEKNSFKYGTQKARLNSESFLVRSRFCPVLNAATCASDRSHRLTPQNFDSCALCLRRARPPVKLCDQGHVYCNVSRARHSHVAGSIPRLTRFQRHQECVVESLVQQKKEIKRAEMLVDQLKAEEASQREAAREAARQRVLDDFEATQTRFVSNGIGSGVAQTGSTKNKGKEAAVSEEPRGQKRKFDLDDDHVQKLVNESEERAMAQLEKEQAEARKAKLPSFWLPSLTPDAGASTATQISQVQLKPTTLCYASDPPHPMSLKSLTPITFATTRSTLQDPTPTDTSNEDPLLCWVCRKVLSNTSKCSAAQNCG